MQQYEQDRVSDKEKQYAYNNERKTANIDQSSSVENIAIAFLVIRIRVVEVVVLLDVLGEEGQPLRTSEAGWQRAKEGHPKSISTFE